MKFLWAAFATLIVVLVELVTLQRIRGQHYFWPFAPSLRWWYTGADNGRSGWICLDFPWFRRHRRAIGASFLFFASLTTILFVSGCAAGAFLTDLESVVPIALTGITAVLSILAGVDPALVPVVAILTPMATKIESDLNELKSLQEDYKSNASEGTLTSIETLITTITGDLSTLLQTNGLPAAQAAQVQAIATALNSELQNLLTTLPVFSSATAGQTLSVTKPIPAAAFKAKIAAAKTTPAVKPAAPKA
jgi:hypothetical protein